MGEGTEQESHNPTLAQNQAPQEPCPIGESLGCPLAACQMEEK